MSRFALMAKPVGSLCNMSCHYCYYLHADNMQDFSTLRMKDDVLEEMIRAYLTSEQGNTYAITWHGGEPTLAGIDFYEKAVALEKKYLPSGKNLWNNIQTNGLLMNDEWCEFFERNHFDVGVSIDGTGFVHNTYRNDTSGKNTYEQSAKAVALLKKHHINPDLLCTVTRETAENAKSVYAKLLSYHTGWIQFIPIVRRTKDGSLTPDSVTPELYGSFLKTVFKEWFFHDLGKANIQLFAETALTLSGKNSNVCWMNETCGNVVVVEKDGTVYSCDHFVNQDHRLGNIMTDRLVNLVTGQKQTDFGRNKRDSLSQECLSCQYLSLCHGCCPKDRFSINKDGEKQYFLCEGLKDFYDYAVPLLQKAMKLSARGYSSSEIMKISGK